MEEIEKILREKPIVLPRYLFNYYLRLGITSDELIVLIFIIDKGDRTIYNPEDIAINEKKIISISVEKNSDGKREEYILLDLLYKKLISIIISKDNEDKTLDNSDIYSIFEKEFGRTISPMECQIIKGWIDDKISHELIMEALKEAVYNGANSFRYIEKILYEWRKKGYKTKEDVINAKVKYRESKKETKDIFHYDWLNDD